jgi:hypothetical protein
VALWWWFSSAVSPGDGSHQKVRLAGARAIG